MKMLLSSLFSIALLGCNQTAPPTNPTTNSTTTPQRSVTTNRPVEATNSTATAQTADRDNTGVNVRDRDNVTKTPIDQNENQADVKITADIRKRVVATKMSINAQNVKIITQDGRVTLRGPVESEDEKRQIEVIAVEVAGADRVDNQIEVDEK